MNTELLIELLKIAGYVILGGIALYLNTKGNLKEKAAGFIAKAEETYKDTTPSGGAKFEYVVDKLYALVPAAFKLFITRDMLGQIVQGAFDAIEAYAKTQLDKVTAKAETAVSDPTAESGEAKNG